jgi:Chromo (CHRromatin Organisation MOdifier) domain
MEVYNRAMEAQANKSRREDDYKVGDLVLLSTRFFKPPADLARGRKLAPKYAGPYQIIDKVSPVAYKLQLPPGTNAHPVFHSSLLRTYHADNTGERILAIPEPVCVEGHVEYVVEKILRSRQLRGRAEYLVHWQGCHTNDATWEPRENVQGSEALREYEELRLGKSVVNQG